MVSGKPDEPLNRLTYYPKKAVLFISEALKLIGKPQFKGQVSFVLIWQAKYGSFFASDILTNIMAICTGNIWDDDFDATDSGNLDDFESETDLED